jgi:glycine cleavage system transcriptional repressor
MVRLGGYFLVLRKPRPHCGDRFRATWLRQSTFSRAERCFYDILASMETYLVVSALGADRTGLVKEFTAAISDSGCSVKDSRMAVLGSEFAISLMIAGNWNSVAKFESALPRLGERLSLAVQSRRTQRRTNTSNHIPYAVEVVALDHTDIVHDVADFFARRDINVEDLYTASYPAPHTGAPMFSLHMTVGIPAELAIAAIRGEFMDFCDDLNLDAMLAPVK